MHTPHTQTHTHTHTLTTSWYTSVYSCVCKLIHNTHIIQHIEIDNAFKCTRFIHTFRGTNQKSYRYIEQSRSRRIILILTWCPTTGALYQIKLYLAPIPWEMNSILIGVRHIFLALVALQVLEGNQWRQKCSEDMTMSSYQEKETTGDAKWHSWIDERKIHSLTNRSRLNWEGARFR